MAIGLHSLPKVLDHLPGGGGVVHAVDVIVNWARANSLWPLVYGTSCCAIEMMATGAARHDIARFGSEVFRASPRQADLIILAGTLTEKMSDHLRTLYEQMPDPKWVIAMGSCTISGGPFYYDSYSVVRGADRVIPVDVFLPGCPPRPEALLHALMEIQTLIRSDSIRRPRTPRPLVTTPAVDRMAVDAKAWAAEQEAVEAELAPQRAAWKEAHPDFKSFKHPKLDKPVLEVVARIKPLRQGLMPSRMFALIAERFPGLGLAGRENTDEATLAALDADSESILDLVVDAGRYAALIGFLKGQADFAAEVMHQLTAVDDGTTLTVLVHLLSVSRKHKIFVRCVVDRATPELASVASLYPAAIWHERETAEMFGVVFSGHPDPRRLFLPAALVGYPLRKDWRDAVRVVEREA